MISIPGTSSYEEDQRQREHERNEQYARYTKEAELIAVYYLFEKLYEEHKLPLSSGPPPFLCTDERSLWLYYLTKVIGIPNEEVVGGTFECSKCKRTYKL